ncbi:MAG: arylsulfatase [Flavobacteriaceae bacterium]|tara:strand:+ start:7777 stop:9273 length:1497 start_codon:yes stop_codon:yes gene_type:complete
MKKLLLYIGFLFLVNSCKNSNKVSERNHLQPNIIFILADDLGYGDVGVYGQQNFETPNLDRLAHGGMKFLQHYSGSTVCAPSRSALMTGQHTGHTFIRGNSERGFTLDKEGQYPLAPEEITIAEVLKKGGYATGAFGKWGLGYPGSEGDPTKQGFDEFFGYNCQRVAHNYYPTHLWDNLTKTPLKGNDGKTKTVYAPLIIHEKALSFIEKNKGRPFFMYYPSVIPHAELAAPEKYMEKYRGKFMPEKEYIKKGNSSPNSKVNPESINNYNVGGYNSQKESHAAFAAMVSLLDEQVGQIIDKVDDLGIAENTLIIFSSDNGPHLEGGADPDYFGSNGPLRGYKRDLYEGGIRVPTLAYWPSQITPNSKSDHISAFWDFFPTAIEIAGLDYNSSKIDGISFLPELKGKDQKKHPYLYWEFLEKGGRQAVRMNQWKAVRMNMSKNPDSPIELYNVHQDIGEQENLAVQYPEVLKEVSRIMNKEHISSRIFQFEFEKTKPRD